VAGVTLHGFNQVGDEIVALLELDRDVGPSLIHRLAEADKPVVGDDGEERDHDDHANDDPPTHDTGLRWLPDFRKQD